MLRKMVLPDNVAPQLFPQIFFGADTKICGKNVLGGLAILCVRNGMRARGKPWHLRAYLPGYFHILHTHNVQKSCSLAQNIVRKSPKRLAPYYEAPIRHESCQTTPLRSLGSRS